jgi:zinc metalloprotease ZmpB
MKYRLVFRASLIVFVLLGVISGSALAAKSRTDTSTGTGRVFLPNPVAELQDQSLTDQKDADYAALQPAYHIVTLTNLDGSGYLQGDWANIHNQTGSGAFSEDNTFVYARDDERFEQVMAYYWVTEAQKYIQSLGFGSIRRPINMELIIRIPGINTISCVSGKVA